MSLAIDSPTLQERLHDLREEHDVPGASVAVLRDGDGRRRRLRDAQPRHRRRGDDRLAVPDRVDHEGLDCDVVMQLVDEGLVDLDAPVRRYLPGFRVADEDVTERSRSGTC